MVKRANLQIYQGDDYVATVTVKNADGTPADLSGYTAKAQIRRNVADLQPAVTVELLATIASPFINLFLTHDQTLVLSGTYVWDLQLTEIATGAVTTILAGQVPVTPEVTRDLGSLRRVTVS
jgi:hypothetical protein